MADTGTDRWVGFAFGLGVAAILIGFGAIGVVSGEFWLPTYRMKRSVHGGFARVMGGIAMAGGVALLVGLIFFGSGPEVAREGQPNSGDEGSRKKRRSKAARQRQAEEQMAAGHLGLGPAAKDRSGGGDDPGPTC